VKRKKKPSEMENKENAKKLSKEERKASRQQKVGFKL